MLTKDVINLVDELNNIELELIELDNKRTEKIDSICKLLHPRMSDINITGFNVVQYTMGNKTEKDIWVDEHCGDSLYNPDSGWGSFYYPLETGDYLRVDYVW